MQAVAVVVPGQRIALSLQLERRAPDAIAHPADKHAHAAAEAPGIHADILKAQIDVVQPAIPILDQDAGDDAAEVEDGYAGSPPGWSWYTP